VTPILDRGFKEARDLLRGVRYSREREEGQAQFAKLVELVEGERPKA